MVLPNNKLRLDGHNRWFNVLTAVHHKWKNKSFPIKILSGVAVDIGNVCGLWNRA